MIHSLFNLTGPLKKLQNNIVQKTIYIIFTKKMKILKV